MGTQVQVPSELRLVVSLTDNGVSMPNFGVVGCNLLKLCAGMQCRKKTSLETSTISLWNSILDCSLQCSCSSDLSLPWFGGNGTSTIIFVVLCCSRVCNAPQQCRVSKEGKKTDLWCCCKATRQFHFFIGFVDLFCRLFGLMFSFGQLFCRVSLQMHLHWGQANDIRCLYSRW